jgi:integrase
LSNPRSKSATVTIWHCAREAAKRKDHGKPFVKVRPFLYNLRRTFLTRLGESGCDIWTLARIAGHGSITSDTYIHQKTQCWPRSKSWVGTKLAAVPKLRVSVRSRNLL